MWWVGNTCLNMLCTCPVYIDPRHGKSLPTLHTHTKRSSLPVSNNDASSFQATLLTHPACFSSWLVKRNFATHQLEDAFG